MTRRITCALLFLVTVNLEAATFLVRPDDWMVRQAESIVTGVVTAEYARLDAKDRIETVYELVVDDAIKSTGPHQVLTLVEAGGSLGMSYLHRSGAPHYEVGQRYLIFLTRNRSGQWTTFDAALGAFRFADSSDGPLLLRDTREAGGWFVDGREFEDQARFAEPFLAFVRDTAGGRNVTGDYFLDGTLVRPEPEAATPPPRSTVLDFDLVAATQIGIDRWVDDPGSTISYTLSSQPCPSNISGNDGHECVIPEDPENAIPGRFPSGSSTIALAFSGCVSCSFHTSNGEQFAGITYSDIIVNDGVSSSTISLDEFQTTMVHEIGHTLGARHSNRDKIDTAGDSCAAPLPCCTRPGCSAVMNAFIIAGLEGTLQDWDLDFANEVYGSGAREASFRGTQYVFDFDFKGDVGRIPARRQRTNVGWEVFGVAACTAPSISSHPTSTTVNPGFGSILSVSATGTDHLTYQWYEGESGDNSKPVTGADESTFVTPALTVTTVYWVRISNSCGTANSNTATVIVRQPRRRGVRR